MHPHAHAPVRSNERNAVRGVQHLHDVFMVLQLQHGRHLPQTKLDHETGRAWQPLTAARCWSAIGPVDACHLGRKTLRQTEPPALSAAYTELRLFSDKSRDSVTDCVNRDSSLRSLFKSLIEQHGAAARCQEQVGAGSLPKLARVPQEHEVGLDVHSVSQIHVMQMESTKSGPPKQGTRNHAQNFSRDPQRGELYRSHASHRVATRRMHMMHS